MCTTKKVWVLVLIWVIFGVSWAEADLPYAAKQDLVMMVNGASSVVAADFDRDGQQDLAFAGIEADGVWVYLRGPAPSVELLAAGFEQACFVRAGDVDADGWPDVVGAACGAEDNSLRWWENPGSGGGAWSEHVVATGLSAGPTRSVDLGDLDHDGDLDLVATVEFDGPVTFGDRVIWYRNEDGVGDDWYSLYVGGGLDEAYDAVIADLNNDGLRDVAAIGFLADTVEWYENDGTSSALDWDTHTVTTFADGGICISAADMDADGDQDLLLCEHMDDQISWYENMGEDSWLPHFVESSYNAVHSAQAVDLDRDGDLDVVATSWGDDRVSWFEQTTFGFTPRDLDIHFDGARAVAVSDFDADGDLDIVAAAQNDDEISWWENLSMGWTPVARAREDVQIAYSPRAIAAADVDNDGDLDLVGSTNNDSNTYIDLFWWEQNGSSWDPHYLATMQNGANSVRVADINGDGDQDLVFSAGIIDAVKWFERLDDGSYLLHTVATGINGARDADVGDFDCDGDLDIAALSYTDGELFWWENDTGDGTSWTEHLVVTSEHTNCLRVANVDGAGGPDIVVSNYVNDTITLFLNSACTTAAWVVRPVAIGFDGPIALEVADLDGDSRPEIIASGTVADEIAVFFRDGMGWTKQVVSSSADGVWDLATGDVDFDGDLDILSAQSSTGTLRWWTNRNGSGTSWLGGLVLASDLDGVRSVDIADLNGDGLPDVAAAAQVASEFAIIENASGQFSRFTFDQAPAELEDGGLAEVLRVVPLYVGDDTDLEIEVRSINLRIDDGLGNALNETQVNNLLSTVRVYRDGNGNGTFEESQDALLNFLFPISVGPNGSIALPIPHGGNNPPVDHLSFETFFVVVTTTENASSHSPSSFRLTHFADPPALASYYDFPDVRLRSPYWSPVSSSTVSCVAELSLIFADDFESGDLLAW